MLLLLRMGSINLVDLMIWFCGFGIFWIMLGMVLYRFLDFCILRNGIDKWS